MALWGYLQQVQRFLDDPSQQLYNPNDLISYINQARKRVAAEAQCVRRLPPGSGIVSSLTLTAAGSGYNAAPTVTIGPPTGPGGIQATAIALPNVIDFYGTPGPIQFVAAGGNLNFHNGPILGLFITNPGFGYLETPTVTITGGGGSGATATATVSPYSATTVGQEVYPFSFMNTAIQQLFPGVDKVIGVQSIAVSWGAWTPVLDFTDFSTMQAMLRSNNSIFQNYPTIWSQYGQGVDGSVYLWPIPSNVTPMEWDCYCLPIDLVDDTTAEAVPYPWTEAVPYYATYLALLGVARGAGRDDTRYFLAEYKRVMAEGRTYVSPATTPTFYPGL